MIMGNIVQGPWAGAGLGGLEQGTDFKCTSTICYGVTKPGEQAPGAVHQTFLGLQRAINRWSGKARFTPVPVDGKIGAATVEALQKAGNAAMDTLPLGVKDVAKQIFASSLTKENVAANAVKLTESLNSAADKLEAQGALPPPRPAPSATPSSPTGPAPGTAIVMPTAPMDTEGKSNLIWWLLGGFAVVATAGIGTAMILRRRKRKTAPARGARRAHA